MNAEILETINTLIKTGGSTAVWCVIVIYAVALLKQVIGWLGAGIILTIAFRAIHRMVVVTKEES